MPLAPWRKKAKSKKQKAKSKKQKAKSKKQKAKSKKQKQNGPRAAGRGLGAGLGALCQRSRRIRSSSSRIRQTAPTLMAMSARLKAGKCPPWKMPERKSQWKSRKSTT